MDDCIHSLCPHNRGGQCLDPVLKDPYKQTGCIFYDGKNVNTYPKDEGCKFCINRWTCSYQYDGICER